MVEQIIKKALRPFISYAIQTSERLRWSGIYSNIHANLDSSTHINEAVAWLMRAQDAGNNRGVSYGTKFGGGFLESYPETTGYIIPTFIELADYYDDPMYLKRAVQMGDWEIEVQMDCGAVMGGIYNQNPTPAVFNTGQVLLGWAALYRKTGEQRFLDAAQHAADWLVRMQNEDGHWSLGNSMFANPTAVLYNVKAAWGLLEAGLVGDWEDAIQGAIRNAEFCLTKQFQNGWFADCCLSDATQPLLHTIAYTMQGLVGIGIQAHRSDFIQAAAKTADALISLMDESGFIPGRIDAAFRGTVNWCCLTGTAQTSIVWSQLYELTATDAYRQAVSKANQYLMARHDITNQDPAIRGGVAGSWPVWGDYGRYSILNWATKFFVDALLMEEKIHCQTRSVPTSHPQTYPSESKTA
jgi:hypothetical protein